MTAVLTAMNMPASLLAPVSGIIMAGATAVSVGTANFFNPYAMVEIAEGIQAFMKEQGVQDIQELIGAVR